MEWYVVSTMAVKAVSPEVSHRFQHPATASSNIHPYDQKKKL
jgi:hypothetical protein